MLGTTVIIPSVLVPQMGGGNEEKAQGNPDALLRHRHKHLTANVIRVFTPVMMGGSYTFAMPTISIILAERYDSVADPREELKD